MADESPFQNAKALIVDSSASARHGLQLALTHLKVAKIVHAPRVVEARRAIAVRKFDIILCDYNFDHGPSGCEFFEELRRTRALPLATIFFMITGEATLAKVVDVVESAPDDYLIKPVNAVTLDTRLRKALEKKTALAALYTAFEAERFDEAVRIGADLLSKTPCPHRVDISRLMAQAHLAMEQVDQAVALYDNVISARAVPWSRVGFHGKKGGGALPSRGDSILKNLMAENGDYLDAYDKLARLRAKEGKFNEALEIYERALKVSPRDLGRLQTAGQLAFCLGNRDSALAHLGKAVALGGRALELDKRSLLHLAILHYDQEHGNDVQRIASVLEQALASTPQDFRAKVLWQLATVCADLAQHQVGSAVNAIRQVAFQGSHESMTFELACDFLCILDRMYVRDIRNDLDFWVAQIARRFAVSPQSSAMMADLMRNSAPLAEIVRENAASIQTLANEGMELMVAGQAQDATIRLLEYGEDTFNARLFAIACSAALKASESGPDEKVDQAGRRAYDLLNRFGEGGLHLPQTLAERVQKYGALNQTEMTAPVTDLAQPQAAVE